MDVLNYDINNKALQNENGIKTESDVVSLVSSKGAYLLPYNITIVVCVLFIFRD